MARKKQTELPGMERKTIREVNDAAEAYVDARDERMRLTEKEVERKQALISAMQKHELVEGKVNVKVALESDDGPEEVRAA